MQNQVPFVCEGLHHLETGPRVFPDTEIEVDAFCPIAKVMQDIPECQAVLASRHTDSKTILWPEHGVVVNGSSHLPAHVFDEVAFAERRVVTPHFDGSALFADETAHQPPEITGRNSTVSSWASCWSRVRSSCPRITRTE